MKNDVLRVGSGVLWAILLAVLLATLGCEKEPSASDSTKSSASSVEDSPRFEDRAQAAGVTFTMNFLPNEQGAKFKINFYDHGAGVAIGDYDGDGYEDIYFANQLGGNALYKNLGDGRFEDVTASVGPIALADRISVSAVFNDVDNDGDLDLFVTTTRGGNALFQNDGAKFSNVTKKAGVEYVGHSQGATFFDAENDGDLDLLVSNTAYWTTDVYDPRAKYYVGAPDLFKLIQSPPETNLFYENKGDGTFVEATERSGLEGVGWSGDTAVFDFDEDGDSDVLVANMFGLSSFYVNDGQGRFTQKTKEVLGRTPFGTVGARAFDYDGDGLLDLYLVDMHSDMWMPFGYGEAKIEEKKKYPLWFGRMVEESDWDPKADEEFALMVDLDRDAVFFGNGLYRNKGNGKFEEVSDIAGAETFWPWGIAEGDFDGDGDEDVFSASGMGFPFFYWRSAFLVNNGDGTFTENSKGVGLDPPTGGENLGFQIGGRKATRSARSAAVADLDRDGRLDIIVNNFNDRPNLYFNRFPQRNYIGFQLTGKQSNRDAIGAVVKVHAGKRVMVRLVQAAGGYLGQSSRIVHFGLGDTTTVDRCEIRWPSGIVQTIGSPETNRVHAVTESAP